MGPMPSGAARLAGGWCWFTDALAHERGRAPDRIAATDIPADVLARLTALRAPIAGIGFERPSIMGILNVTPDSFSDGGQFHGLDAALAQAAALSRADILDIGGESTRPGARMVGCEAEIKRTAPLIEALRMRGFEMPISIDTRKSAVAQAAMTAGANLINDVSAMQFDLDMAAMMARSGAPICLMHAQGAPETMQDDPRYADVLFDVYDALAARVAQAEAAGIPRDRILLDPGIGFGKTRAHNLELLRGIALFHALGCPILLGVSRKRFIGDIGAAPDATARMPGSLAVTLAALGQGVQMHRVHDVNEVAQGIALWRAVMIGEM
jgi:dihydropteroate synthase